jgi:hypothetical protein
MDADDTYCGHVDDFREWAEARGIGFKTAMVMAIRRMMRDTEALGDMDLQTETLSAEAETLSLKPTQAPRGLQVRLALAQRPKPTKPERKGLGRGRGRAADPEMTAKANEAHRLMNSGVPVHEVWRRVGFKTMQAMRRTMTSRGMWGSSEQVTSAK